MLALPFPGQHLGVLLLLGSALVTVAGKRFEVLLHPFRSKPSEAAIPKILDQLPEIVLAPGRYFTGSPGELAAAEKDLEKRPHAVVPMASLGKLGLPIEEPQTEARIRPGGNGGTAVTTDNDVGDRTGVSLDHACRGPGSHIPQSQRRVLARRQDEAGVRRKRHRLNRPFMSG